MSRFLITRRVGVLTAAATAAVLGTAAPALADVTVNPSSAPQGSGANLTFRVTNTDKSPITRVKLLLPADTPIAEVYPLSVDDWAPQITNRTLSTPLETVHGGTETTQTASAVTWIAMPGKSLAPGKSADLSVAVGPLPTLSQMQFTVQATYANGTAGAAMPPATLTLTPATAEQQAAGHSSAHDSSTTGGNSSTTGGSDADDSAFAAVVAQADQGPSMWSIGGWILAALAAAAAIVAVLRGRHRATPDTDADTDTDAADGDAADEPNDETEQRDGVKEPVGASAGKTRASAWRYQDGPE